MPGIDEVTDDVQKQTSVKASVKALLGNLSTSIKDAGGDQRKLTALSQQIDSNVEAWANAVLAGTPAEMKDSESESEN